jgi:uncharacterized delta-60 repeat protein
MNGGALDPTFGTGGLLTTGLTYSGLNSGVVQPDGKVVLAGLSQGATSAFSVGRILTSGPMAGQLDPSFGVGGIAQAHFAATSTDVATDAAIQSDGKIVVGGITNADSFGINIFGIVRFNTDGTLDTSFGVNGFATITFQNTTDNEQLSRIAIQNDGRIVVAGTRTLPQGTAILVGRLNSDGTQDSNFFANARANFSFSATITGGQVSGDTNAITGLVIQPNNQIVMTGFTNLTGDRKQIGTTNSYIAMRFNSLDGTLDTTFGISGLQITDFFGADTNESFLGSNDTAHAAVLLPNGNVAVAGQTMFGGGGGLNFALAQYTSGGILDRTYNLDGLNSTDFATNFALAVQDAANSIVLQSDGRLVLAGTSTRNGTSGFALLRYNTDGSLDQNFGVHGQVVTNFSQGSNDVIDDLFLLPDGSLFAAGTSNGTFAEAHYLQQSSSSFQFSSPVFSVVENAGTATLTVTRTGNLNSPATVQFATSDSTAHAGMDYTTASGPLNFAANQSSASIQVTITDNAQILNKTFNVTLSSPTGGALLGNPGIAQVLITAATSGQVQFSSTSYTVAENGGSATITVLRSPGSTTAATVNFMTSDNTAVAGTNYRAISGSLPFGIGQTSATFTIPILDTMDTTARTVNLTLTNATGTALGSPTTAVLTITGHLPGNLQFNPSSYFVAENAGKVTLTVMRIGAFDVPATVQFATSDGTAQAGTNYTAMSGTLVFGAGQQSAAFTIPILDDGVFQTPNKQFNVTLSNAGGNGILGGLTTAVVTIGEKDGNANQNFVAQAYEDLLQRPVDQAGLAYWVGLLNNGATRQQVAFGIQSSQEYRQLEVQQLYQQYLHRSADASGLNTFTSMLASGGTVENVAAALVGSQEYFLNRGSGTNGGFLNALYQDALLRNIDASGLATFSQMLAGGADRGQVAAAIFGSTEYRQDLVSGYYTRFLRRTVDDSGLNLFVNLLAAGAQGQQPIFVSDPQNHLHAFTDEAAIAVIVGSQEYLNRLS